ncbi:Putative vacuolar membrane transporter for cationic amino acids [Komagataella phaffii CBS 7435]|uniref:Vacuolar membrane transporter for cationic amino acids n=2 Tax=Komagataella phaffii TaxID=460519 RepID=C4R7P2_KOMPG|nr:uncharacterized protein PAS_chr4_0372 [Komagataella phaffii GS115]AOA64799.1 GQ67_04717T0 [Komagataella phaffii]CAH2451002.1 Putative vacuolar membrane transporter for cationic amino acids [Komagataella phaffii CBS 7435]AOA70146.1 GQ68_04689T0 [Komagataella phaffii GS115]CAY71617.1 Putative protein of unknown function [Komagataella phaffii GS115]SCV12389.1 Putative vacuolar membrane transporter for cationic amino acids [Komagataella phaffii CBS 7435]
MLSVTALSEMFGGDSPTLREALSGIAGSTSLACWIVLLLPQLVEQWKYKSAEGISIEFIALWFLGDVANLIGALWANLLPQVILLAIWYCLADFLIGFSYYYYTYIYPKHHRHHHLHLNSTHSHRSGSITIDETSALVNRRHSSRSRRRSSIEVQVLSDNRKHIFTNIVLPVLFVLLAGASGYFFSGETTHHTPGDGDDLPHEKIRLGPQILGYISATLYLTARLPQIYQNYVKKSCKGLSLLFFIFSTVGNLTYSLQIVLYRSDWEYVILNLSWLLGSFGTIFEDSFIFFQFWLYRNNDNPDVYISDGDEPAV